MKKSVLLLFAFLLTNSAFAQSNRNVEVINTLNQKSAAINNLIKTSLNKNNFVLATRDNSDSVLEISEIDTHFAFSTVAVSVKLKNLKNEHRDISTTGVGTTNLFLAVVSPESEKLRVTKVAVSQAMERLSNILSSKHK